MKILTDALYIHASKVIFILAALFVIHFFLVSFSGRFGRFLTEKISRTKNAPSDELRKRVQTLSSVFSKLFLVLIWGVGITIILGELGFSIGPILTAAGVFGLAVSFGAQSLIKDIISGVFILIEDQIRVGDVAIINGTKGLVEEINLRTIIIRDLAGVVHVFPNGTIDTLSNMTRDWSAALLNIGVAYKENLREVIKIMKEVCEEMRSERPFSSLILEPMEVFGVDEFADSAIIIKARIKTKPNHQWVVGREYRLRLKEAFDARNIEIPFPHMSVYFGEASKPFKIQKGE